MRYDTLLFDADGTLLDFSRSEHEAFVATIATLGITADDKLAHDYSIINDSLWKQLEQKKLQRSELRVRRFALLAEKYGFDCDAEGLSEIYINELASRSYLLGNALEVCTRLFERGHRLYLITNGFVKVQQGRFMTSPLRPLFRDVFISDEIGFDKPALQYFDAVRARIPDFEASRTLVIGDSLTSDMRGGINAGLDVCWFDPHHLSVPQDMHINYVIDDLEQLYDITK